MRDKFIIIIVMEKAFYTLTKENMLESSADKIFMVLGLYTIKMDFWSTKVFGGGDNDTTNDVFLIFSFQFFHRLPLNLCLNSFLSAFFLRTIIL